jgi:Uma2 family endonuclease
MTTTPVRRLVTADELQAMPDDGKQRELVRGKLVVVSPSSARPSAIAINLAIHLGAFVKQHRLGRCLGADGGYRLASQPDTVRAPNVSFIRSEQLPGGRLPDTFFPGAPDLAVEVLSPSDRVFELIEKANDYLTAGTRLVWVIDPRRPGAIVFRPNAAPEVLGGDGVLNGEDVVPGFSVTLTEILT